MILKKNHAYRKITYKYSLKGYRTKSVSESVTVPSQDGEWPGDWEHWEKCMECRMEKIYGKIY